MADDTTKSKSSYPYYLHSHKRLKHFYVEPVQTNFVSRKFSSSLGYQMEMSIKDLENELRAAGKDFDFVLQGGIYGDWHNQWTLYVNGEQFASIDEDYGYDCFDKSPTHFKETIASLIDSSGIESFTEQERATLDAQRKASRLAKSMNFSERVEAITNEEEFAHSAIKEVFDRLKRL